MPWHCEKNKTIIFNGVASGTVEDHNVLSSSYYKPPDLDWNSTWLDKWDKLIKEFLLPKKSHSAFWTPTDEA